MKTPRMKPAGATGSTTVSDLQALEDALCADFRSQHYNWRKHSDAGRCACCATGEGEDVSPKPVYRGTRFEPIYRSQGGGFIYHTDSLCCEHVAAQLEAERRT
jgi:hypothetical protein